MSSYPGSGGSNLVDILDRVLDKGLVVAGDIKVSLANVELLTIRIRLLVCSIDKAEQIGLNWWRYDQSLVKPEGPSPEERARTLADADIIARLERRIAQLETQLVAQRPEASPPASATISDNPRPRRTARASTAPPPPAPPASSPPRESAPAPRRRRATP
jgi:hypothetical protein